MMIQPVEIELGNPGSAHPRSEGIHLSRVLRSMAFANGVLDKKWVNGDLGLIEVNDGGESFWSNLDPASRLRMSMGIAWEEWYIPQLGDVVKHPGEMLLDGIYMTHDGESLDTIIHREVERVTLALHEVKLTFKSTNTVGDLRNEWLWLSQMMGYCKGLRTRVAYMHTLFVCGDYRRPITPQLKCWRIEFSQLEIDRKWEEVTGHVRQRMMMEQV